MVKVDEYARIRQAYFRDQLSIRALARLFHHSRDKIREIVGNPEPRPYTRQQDPRAPILDPFKPVIDSILAADLRAPAKQRHTAAKIFRRLQQEHGYAGGYDRVRRYVQAHRRQQQETFIPLRHDPGQRLECDFGHIYVDFPEGRRQGLAHHLGVLGLSFRPGFGHGADRGDPVRPGRSLRVLWVCGA
jgi:transposase